MMMKRDARWIYDTLEKAFTQETGLQCQSVGRIELKPLIPELEGTYGTIYGKFVLEVDYIEFEVDESE